MIFKKIDFTIPGGLFEYQGTLDFLQDAYSKLSDAIATFYGEKVIVQGCVIAGGNISSGWVVLNGELLPVVGGSLQSYVFVDDLSATDKLETFDDGSQHPVYTSRSVKFTAISSGSTTAWNLFKRVPFKASTLLEAFTKIQTIISATIGVENAVILSGCDVSAIGGGNCTISAGVVLMDGEYVAAPLRAASAYPCWLKPDGTYATADPGGTNVKFDPHTSQRYKHVLKRFQHETGEVVMSLNPDDQDLFDVGTGLGKWKWLGWKLSPSMRGRVPVGVDVRTADPLDGVWDANYNDVDNTVGNDNTHEITQAELPHIRLGTNIFDEGGGYDDAATQDNIGPNNNGDEILTDYLGDGDAMDLRQPGRTVLFIERL